MIFPVIIIIIVTIITNIIIHIFLTINIISILIMKKAQESAKAPPYFGASRQLIHKPIATLTIIHCQL